MVQNAISLTSVSCFHGDIPAGDVPGIHHAVKQGIQRSFLHGQSAAAANVQPRYPVLACDCGGTAKPVYSGGTIVRYVCDSCGAVYYPK